MRRGQALVELTVFGAIFLVILGALVSYGLRYNYMQQVNQQAFRRAMKIAADPDRGSGSYVMFMDKHIPDPADPFGVGTVLPMTGSASVMRTNMADAQADDAAGLPTTVLDFQENQDNGVADPMRRIVYKSAGFRWETLPAGSLYGFSEAQVNKSRLIYGDVYENKSGDLTIGLRIVDSCSGEAPSYDTCYAQAVRLVDAGQCTTYCNSVNSNPDINCALICGTNLNAPNNADPNFYPALGGPWYAAGYTRHSPDSAHASTWYTFPVLDQLFADIPTKTLGFQSDGTSANTYRKDTFDRTESSGGGGQIVTQETSDWANSRRMNFVTHQNLDANGLEITHPTAQAYADASTLNNQTLVSTVGGSSQSTWTTDKSQ